MDEWVWVKNEAVNQIPGRIPAGELSAWEARGWKQCPAPTDDVEPDAPAPAVKPSTSGPKKENDRG